MSTQYCDWKEVPTHILVTRLKEPAGFVTKGDFSDFSMRVPAELDRDADLTMTGAARRIELLEAELAQERKRLDWALKNGSWISRGNSKRFNYCDADGWPTSIETENPRATIDELMGDGK